MATEKNEILEKLVNEIDPVINDVKFGEGATDENMDLLKIELESFFRALESGSEAQRQKYLEKIKEYKAFAENNFTEKFTDPLAQATVSLDDLPERTHEDEASEKEMFSQMSELAEAEFSADQLANIGERNSSDTNAGDDVAKDLQKEQVIAGIKATIKEEEFEYAFGDDFIERLEKCGTNEEMANAISLHVDQHADISDPIKVEMKKLLLGLLPSHATEKKINAEASVSSQVPSLDVDEGGAYYVMPAQPAASSTHSRVSQARPAEQVKPDQEFLDSLSKLHEEGRGAPPVVTPVSAPVALKQSLWDKTVEAFKNSAFGSGVIGLFERLGSKKTVTNSSQGGMTRGEEIKATLAGTLDSITSGFKTPTLLAPEDLNRKIRHMSDIKVLVDGRPDFSAIHQFRREAENLRKEIKNSGLALNPDQKGEYLAKVNGAVKAATEILNLQVERIKTEPKSVATMIGLDPAPENRVQAAAKKLGELGDKVKRDKKQFVDEPARPRR